MLGSRGGTLEFGEDPAAAVLREVKEEYGVSGVIEKALPPVSLIREHNGQTTHWITFPFIIKIPRDGIRIGEPEYTEEIGWFPLGKFPIPLHTGMSMIMERLSDHFRLI